MSIIGFMRWAQAKYTIMEIVPSAHASGRLFGKGALSCQDVVALSLAFSAEEPRSDEEPASL